MLEIVKTYIKEISDVPFGAFYQNYICDVQDANVLTEIKGVKTDEITTLSNLIARLRKELK